jgi:hypothetical protein
MDQLSRIVRHLRKGIPWLSKIRNPDIAHSVSPGHNTLDFFKFLFQNLPIKNSSALKTRFRIDTKILHYPVRFYRADASQPEPN